MRFIFWFMFVVGCYDAIFKNHAEGLKLIVVAVVVLVGSYWWEIKRWYKKRRM